ncbi:MAG: hypothetical protein EPO20_05960 [Betaproteobacteria bacterium]|nr:MAG: hypothetical protein EPO20_05960 [Betaproteobacteria bacterium]
MNTVPGNPLNALMNLLNEIRRCQDAGATSAAAVMVYVGIDVMAFLSMPAGQAKQGGADYIAWVDAYMRAVPESTYQYDGRDVYGARCAMLHTYSVEANYHEQHPEIKKFGYHDGGQHAYNPEIDQHLVIIGINSLVHDFAGAVLRFVQTMQTDAALRQRVAGRLPQLVDILPINWNAA